MTNRMVVRRGWALLKIVRLAVRLVTRVVLPWLWEYAT